MRKINLIQSIAIAAAIVIMTSVSGLYAQSRQAEEQGVNVIVGKFYADATINEYLASEIPNLINLSLMNYEGFNMIMDDPRYKTIDAIERGYTQQKFRADYSGLDYIVYGDIISMKKELTINAFVLDVENNITHELRPARGDKGSLFNMCEQIGRDASVLIYDLDRGLAQQGIRIALISDVKRMRTKGGEASDYVTNQLMREAINNLEYFENFVVMPWNESRKYNNYPLGDILSDIKAHGIMHIEVFTDIENVRVLEPTFYLKRDMNSNATDMVVKMPLVHENYYIDFPFQDFAINELIGFMQSAITEDGQWNLEPLLFTTDLPMEYFELAMEYIDNRKIFLSNYFLYKAQDITDDPQLQNEILYNLGKNKALDYRLEEAKEEFTKILIYDPDNVLGFKGLGIVSAINEDYKDALKKFSYVASMNPEDEDINYLLGYTLYELGDYREALEKFEMASDQTSEFAEIEYYAALCYIKLKEYDRGIEEFRKMYEMNPEDADYQYYLSYALGEKGIYEFNNKNYASAAELLFESNQIYRLNYTNNYYRISLIWLNRFEEADEFIQSEILKKNYDPEQIYFQHALDIREYFLSWVNDEIGEYLIRYLEQSLLYNDNPLAYYYIGNAYVNLDNAEKGLEYYLIAHEKDPSNTNLHLDLMEAYLFNNRFGDCIEFYNSKLSRTPDFPVTDDYLALMNYLMISAVTLDGGDASSYQRKLNKFLSTRGFQIAGWSYFSYQLWLGAGYFDQEDKDYLNELTAKMERVTVD